MRVTNFDDLKVQNTILAIACTPSDPLDCIAVGLDGLIVRGDGTNWRIQALPDDGAGAHRTSPASRSTAARRCWPRPTGSTWAKRPATPTCATTIFAPG